MAYSATILADSVSPLGVRLSTFEITFPRFVLAEYNTHRMFSRNSASSRAIPVEKQLKKLEEDPFIPIYWGKNQKGMVAETELDELTIGECKLEWIAARDSALKHARKLMELGVHKQIANRLLEPFMWQTVICTATDWDNFFALRAHPDAQPEIRRIAEMMLQLLKTWQPAPLKIGEWHLPLVSLAEVDEFTKLGLDLKKISAGRCARVSYLTHDGKRDPLADIQLAERLQASGHMCYDSETEVLTNNGWKYWSDISLESEIFAVDIVNQTGRFEIPQALHTYSVDEQLYHIDGQQVDLLVTTNHKMVTSSRKNDGTWTDFDFESASKVIGKPRRYLKAIQRVENSNDDYALFGMSNHQWFSLLGFFVGDGHASKDCPNQIQFHLKKDRKIQFLKMLGIEFSSNQHNKYVITYPGIGDWFRKNCYNSESEKILPNYVLKQNSSNISSLLSGLKNSDGSIKRNTWMYYSTSKDLIDIIQAVLHINGQVGSVSQTEIDNGIYYRLNISNRLTPRVEINQTGRSRTYQESMVLYCGKIYCATTSTGALLVRRNNKVTVSGNSPFEHVATPITEADALAHVVSQIKLDESCGDIEPDVSNLFLGNFKGWQQYRKTIANEDNYAKVEDPRKIGLKNGLRQLTIPQLEKVINHQGDMVLDSYNYSNGKFCPLAIAVGLETMDNPSQEKVYNKLIEMNYAIYNTRGIQGEFYTDNRKEDLILAAKEVLQEKRKI